MGLAKSLQSESPKLICSHVKKCFGLQPSALSGTRGPSILRHLFVLVLVLVFVFVLVDLYTEYIRKVLDGLVVEHVA